MWAGDRVRAHALTNSWCLSVCASSEVRRHHRDSATQSKWNLLVLYHRSLGEIPQSARCVNSVTLTSSKATWVEL
eukprot:COSAG02_NODE_2842_length_7911_cov_6.273682_10_plen_74_part_01